MGDWNCKWKPLVIFIPIYYTFKIFAMILRFCSNTSKHFFFVFLILKLTIYFPKSSIWHANWISLPKTPVTFGESSGFINGLPFSSSLADAVKK